MAENNESETDAIEEKIEKVLDQKLKEEKSDERIEETLEEVEDVTVEDPILTEYGSSKGDSDDERLAFVEKWFPTENDQRGKTRISPTQARALTVMRHLPELYDGLLGEKENEIQELLNGLADNIEVYQTSIGGKSRQEQKDILELAFGGHQEKMQSQESSMLDRYMQSIDEDNE